MAIYTYLYPEYKTMLKILYYLYPSFESDVRFVEQVMKSHMNALVEGENPDDFEIEHCIQSLLARGRSNNYVSAVRDEAATRLYQLIEKEEKALQHSSLL